VSCQNDSFRYLSASRMPTIVAGTSAADRIGHAYAMTTAVRLP
jgi:hypothetical protein